MNVSKDLFGILSAIKWRILWIAVSSVGCLWFSYWIFYDISVWSKPLSQVYFVNIAGLGLSLALILFGTFFGYLNKRISARSEVKIQKQKPSTITLPVQVTPVQVAPVQVAQVHQELKVQPKPSDVPGCNHFLGYLSKRDKSEKVIAARNI